MDNRKAHYHNTSYAGYDKNHKERDKMDYYSTPTEEVTNILEELNIDFSNKTILEPQCGGMHMVKGILDYIENKDTYTNAMIIATDVQKRETIEYNPYINGISSLKYSTGPEYDFLSPSYPEKEVDYIICNPPYATIEPHIMKALSIANKGVLALVRLQFLEGKSRYENIFKEYPPTDVYVYVDRIACFENGDLTKKMASAQAYAWVLWNFTKEDKSTTVHWLRRADKK